MNIVMVHDDAGRLGPFIASLRQPGAVEVREVQAAAEALDLIQEGQVDVVIVDEQVPGMTGVQLVEQLVKRNPFVNCVLVSGLDSEDFHEETEGLGIFYQLPRQPGNRDAELVLQAYRRIMGLFDQPAAAEGQP